MTKMTDAATMTRERADLLQSLGGARYFLRHTLRGLDDEQAVARTTVSELTLAALIKHVTLTERNWARFIVEGASAMPAADDPEATAGWSRGFRVEPGETIATLLAAYEAVAEHTDELVRSLPDLDAEQELPTAPWFPPGARWSARRVVLHIVADTAQHAGHADIIRESLDGAKSMG